MGVMLLREVIRFGTRQELRPRSGRSATGITKRCNGLAPRRRQLCYTPCVGSRVALPAIERRPLYAGCLQDPHIRS